MKKIILKLIDTCDSKQPVYFMEIPKFLKRHYFKKLGKQGYLVMEYDIAQKVNDFLKQKDI